MISIDALTFLFIIQFLIMFLCVSIILFLKYRKLTVREILARGEINRLRSEVSSMELKETELDGIKGQYSQLQSNFEHLKESNTKLRASIDTLIPEAKRSEEQKKIIREIEQTYAELDSICVSIREEKAKMDAQAKSYQSEIRKLSKKLASSVSKDEYDNLQAGKSRLEMDKEKLEKEVKQLNADNDNLQKNYIWLEKEYNALYKNVQESES